MRLDPDEVPLLVELLGRPPLWPEAVLFGILWSEHCSYKSTRHLLRRLPTRAAQVVIGPGEDAGVVSLPAPCEDTVLVLAHESHNHPSQVLPVEGAATGVGGIVRDVACMGAEVVGVLDALRFGDPRSGVHARDVVRGVVQGIADYGNALGVPNLGGDVWFDPRFASNCLVNVMAVGLGPASGVLRSRVPEGAQPWVFVLVGKPTDDSGFGGAAFASEALGDTDDRGAVQLPDPFLKRVLSVANQEAFARIRARGIPAGFKDLGAGGIACATSELAAAGGRGASIALERAHRVPRPMPREVLLCAETQERFCWVVPASFASALCELYNREFALASIYPGAGARDVGRADDSGRYRVTWDDEVLVDVPVDAITSARRIERPSRRRAVAPSAAAARAPVELAGALPRLLSGLDLASREYLFRHYDGEVQGRTWMRAGEGDAVVLRVHARRPTGVAFAVGGNPHWCAADPELGARHAVAEAARNVACVGARPWALTDCLNFGDPEDPEVMGDLEAAIDGLAAAALALGALAGDGDPLPFVSGNVSLYNHAGDSAIPPSPIVMCAGVVRDVAHAVPLGVREPGLVLILAGAARETLTGSSYRRETEPGSHEAPPPLDLALEARLQALAVEAAERGWARAAHDVSDGGLAVALVEMLLGAPALGLGAQVNLAGLAPAPEVTLFSEQPAVVFAVASECLHAVLAAARERDVPAWRLGVTDASASLSVTGAGPALTWALADLAGAREPVLERLWNEELS